MNEIIGAALSLLGSAFLLLASVGMLRMPDAFNRMQTGTKATTLGSILFMVGIGVMKPEWLPKLLLLVAFVVLTNPVSSHALARAAHKVRAGLGARLVVDVLAEAEPATGSDAAPSAGASAAGHDKGARS